MTIKVAINGYGTIGKRVADAVSCQDDMEIIGVTKTRPAFGCDLDKTEARLGPREVSRECPKAGRKCELSWRLRTVVFSTFTTNVI